MKCNNCGRELTDDTKFCYYCGEKVEITAKMPPIPDETVEEKENNIVEDFDETFFTANPQVESFGDKAKNKILKFWDGLSMYGKIATVGLTVFALLGIIALIYGRIFAGVVSIIQIAVMIAVLLMKKGVIKTQKVWIPLVAIILSFTLFIPYCLLFGINTSDVAKYNWNDVVLSDIVPKPSSVYGKIGYNSDISLSLEVKKVSPKNFLSYIEECKNKGFTVDAEKMENHYRAFNKDGFELSIDYDETDKVMTINVNAKRELGTLIWPDNELANLIPEPKSKVGEIINDSEGSFSVYVGETSIDEFNSYITECEKMGFSIETEKGEKEFCSKNADSFSLNVKYEGNNIIYICVDEPDFNVEYEVECVENLMFSKYDVDIYIDDLEEETLEHGKKETFSTVLSRGSHTFKFVSAEDEELTGKVKFDILKDEKLKLQISCSSSGIKIKTIIGPASAEDKHNPTDYSLDYTDAQSFEEALNNGSKVDGKIVQFNVVEYKPDSAMGINCWSGEHLNFISETKLDVSSGDIIIGRVKSEPTKVLGSWKIYYDVLSINGKKTEENTIIKTEETEAPKNPSPVFYSTNDYETAKQGNTGVFAYRDRAGSYDIY